MIGLEVFLDFFDWTRGSDSNTSRSEDKGSFGKSMAVVEKPYKKEDFSILCLKVGQIHLIL